MMLRISKKRSRGKTEYRIIEYPEIRACSYNTYGIGMKHIEIFLDRERILTIYEESSGLKMLGYFFLNMLQFNSYSMYIGEKLYVKIKPAFLFVLKPSFSFITPEERYTLRLHSNNICTVCRDMQQIMLIRADILSAFEKSRYTVECEKDTAMSLAMLFCSFADTVWFKNDMERSAYRYSKSIVPFDSCKHLTKWHAEQ